MVFPSLRECAPGSRWSSSLLLVLVLTAAGLPRVAHAQNVGLASQIGLGCQFASINDALAAAIVGDTVLVAEGITLTESVDVTLDVAIRSAIPTCGAASAANATRPTLKAPVGTRALRVGTNRSVTVRQLVVTDGERVGGLGGNILVQSGADLLLDDVVVRDGRAEFGGGVYVSGGTLRLRNDSSVRDNEADFGGGVYLEGGTLNVLHAAVESNVANADGGGVYVEESTLNATAGTVKLNRAGGAGGGIFMEFGEAVVTDSTLTHNDSGSDGGGLFSQTATLDITGGSIDHNIAGRDGGGLFIDGGDDIEVSTTIEQNRADRSGGGLFLSDTAGRASIDLGETTFLGNLAVADGGGLVARGRDNGVVMRGGYSIEQNIAGHNGGGASVDGRVVWTEPPVQILSNEAAMDGGGLHIHLARYDNKRGDIQHNIANRGGGVAMDCRGGVASPVVLGQHSIAWNRSLGDGAGVALWNGAGGPCELRLVAPTIEGNVADGDGGGIVVWGNVVLDTSELHAHTNVAEHGGARTGTVDVHLVNSIVAENSTAFSEDVVYVGDAASLTASSVSFGLNGGIPLHWDAGSTGSLFNSAISDTTPLQIDPALGALTADCNAVNAVVGTLGGSFDSGLVFADFATSVLRGRFQVDATTALLFDQCASGPTVDIDRMPRPGGSVLWERGAFEAQ